MSGSFDFNKFLAEAAEQMDMTGNLYVATGPDGPRVIKTSAVIPVSLELLLDSGLITEEEARARGWEPTVYPPVPWWRRLRWRVASLRERLAYRLFRLVAGYEMRTDDD